MQGLARQITIIENCPLCGNDSASELASYPEFTWVKCTCGLIYKRSEQQGSDEDGIYDPEYFKAGDSKHAHSYDRRTLRRISKSKRQILDALNHTEQGPVLDVGCSLGYTLQAATNLKLESAGIDIAPFAIEECRARGHRAEFGGLDSMPFDNDSFAVVTMKHVLEHTPKLREALREAKRVLRPGGALFIAIPHAEYFKATRNPTGSKFFRPDTPGGTEHYVYYTPKTLSALLTEEDYIVRRVHPHFIQRNASPRRKIGNLLTAPFRWLGGQLTNQLKLKKEFWLVATAVK